MPVIQANNISIQFGDGTVLFDKISCQLTQRRVALVGRNGVGKSVLAQTLTGQREPTTGSVVIKAKVEIYSQLPSSLLEGGQTVAQFLQLDTCLGALKRIEAGECSAELFDQVGERWQLREELANQLISMGLPPNEDFPCHRLSGGQLARLQLWSLFERESDLLLLDEPSNHLDQQGRQWLIEQMANYSGQILLISHDRQLLREVDQIWELSSLGLTQYGGNYDLYYQQKQREVSALERQIESVNSEAKRLEREAQKSAEKADQRAAQGRKLRRDGSQPKMLLDGMKNSAENSMSNRNKNLNGRRESLSDKHAELSQRYEQVKAQKIYFGASMSSTKRLVTMVDAQLPFGTTQSLYLSLSSGEKLRLGGRNGCGKSTLLNVILGKVQLRRGEIRVNAPVYYLDQHFQLVDTDLSLLENVLHSSPTLTKSDARTLLAGIGFRREEVHRCAAVLSGGEKMKLAMLIVAHQPQPALLLLDEPDNHLDLDSQHLLASTIRDYRGSVVLVSHDEAFVRECGIENTLSF